MFVLAASPCRINNAAIEIMLFPQIWLIYFIEVYKGPQSLLL